MKNKFIILFVLFASTMALAEDATFLVGIHAKHEYIELLNSKFEEQVEVTQEPDGILIQKARIIYAKAKKEGQFSVPDTFIYGGLVEAKKIEGKDYTCGKTKELWIANKPLETNSFFTSEIGDKFLRDVGSKIERSVVKTVFNSLMNVSISEPQYACVRT